MPLTHLDKEATRSANIWDITCDSDGEIPFESSKPLYLHDIDLAEEEYFLAFFLVGAYQDTLGMKHNLFSSPSQVNVEFDDGKMVIKSFIKSQSILDIFDDLDYNSNEILNKILQNIDNNLLKNMLKEYIQDNSYLKTTQSEGKINI